MFRLALFLLLTPLLPAPCLTQQFPIIPGGALPVAAIELDKMPWTRIPGIGAAQEFATIVGDRAKPELSFNLSDGRLTRFSRRTRTPMTAT